MAASTWLAQYHSIKSSSESLVVAIEDLNDLWPSVRELFEGRIPLRKAQLFTKSHSSVVIEKLPLEFVLTTDPRLRARFPLEQSPFVFRLPYATIIMVTCEDIDDYKAIWKPRIKSLVSDEREWFILFVTKANALDPIGKQAKRIYSKLEVDFSSKRRERCCRLDLSTTVSWEEIESRLTECLRITLDRRIQYYDEESKRMSDRSLQGWCFSNLFIVKESSAFMFELTCLNDDALREYEELEQVYLEIVNIPSSKAREFGGSDPGDDLAGLLDAARKPFTQFAVDDHFREFDFRQYLFSHQASLLFKLNRPIDVAGRGLFFILSFSKLLSKHQKDLPFCMREAWVITACLSLIEATGQRFAPRSVTPDMEKDFYRLLADLGSLARTKLMRLGDLIGYNSLLHRSPCNSALLSMNPWPKPTVWPSVPADAAARILAKEEALQEKNMFSPPSPSNLPLSPAMLLREANRRRASLSGGSVSEILESRPSFKESSGSEHSQTTNSLQRNMSSSGRPGSPLAASPLSPGFERPMKLAEVNAAAEYEILKLVSHEGLRKALATTAAFEEMYMELTRAAADNYHRSRKRHGVVLDGELAAVHHRTGNFDSAAKLYEKVCALYSGERWHSLLAEVLPRLAECQKQLGDLAGYLSSCVKLLSLDRGLLSSDQRRSLQSEVVELAHSGLKVPVPVDVSALLSFCGQPGPPLELCEGDPGTFSVIVWSGFLDEISLDSLSMTLTSTSSNDEGAKAIKSAEGPVLQPGKNSVSMQSLAQRPGSYVLGALTGQIGQVKLRSHTNCTVSAIGSPESDEYFSSERPLRPVLQVSVSRPLVEVKPAVSTGLLVGEPQWLGIIIRPIDYSLKGAVVRLTALSGISIYGPQRCQFQLADDTDTSRSQGGGKDEKRRTENGIIAPESLDTIEVKNGSVTLPDWAADAVSVMWLQVMATRSPDDQTVDVQQLATQSDSDPPAPNRKSDEIARSFKIQLDFGVSRSRVYERTMTVLFTEAFRIVTRLVSMGNAGAFMLQVTLISQINAKITILDAALSLQDGFLYAGTRDGKPDPSGLLPANISKDADCALLFLVKAEAKHDHNNTDLPNGGYEKNPTPESALTVRYSITGSRAHGAHSPSFISEEGESSLVFRCSLKLQKPVLDRLVAVGMLPVPTPCPRVGQQVILQWRIERLRKGRAVVADASDSSSSEEDEVLGYEIKTCSETWMIAGRRKGCISLPTRAEATEVVAVACVPLAAGHVHPPSLSLTSVNQRHVSHNPPGPHLVCIFPPSPCYAFCDSQK